MGKVIGPVEELPPPNKGGRAGKYAAWYELALAHQGKFVGYECETSEDTERALNAGYQFGRSNGLLVQTRKRGTTAWLMLEEAKR